jgi:hypothetical protein
VSGISNFPQSATGVAAQRETATLGLTNGRASRKLTRGPPEQIVLSVKPERRSIRAGRGPSSQQISFQIIYINLLINQILWESMAK